MMYSTSIVGLMIATSCEAFNFMQQLAEQIEAADKAMKARLRYEELAPEGCTFEDWYDGCCVSGIGEPCTDRDCGSGSSRGTCDAGLRCSADLLCVAQPTVRPTVMLSPAPSRHPTIMPSFSPTRVPSRVPTKVSGVCKPVTAVDDPEMVIFCNSESQNNKYMCPEIGYGDCVWVDATGPSWCIPTSSEHLYMWENCGARYLDDCERDESCVMFLGYENWEQDLSMVSAMMG